MRRPRFDSWAWKSPWRRDRLLTPVFWGFAGGSDSKESAYIVGDLGLNPRSGRSPGEGNGNPLQDSCLENPTDRGAWRPTVHVVRGESDTTDRLTLTDTFENIVVLSLRSERCIFRNSEVQSCQGNSFLRIRIAQKCGLANVVFFGVIWACVSVKLNSAWC